jgi:3-hydroxyacyl-[acyl-carrier-protein] dehydratase
MERSLKKIAYMLQNDFFTISSTNREGDSFRVLLELNAAHKIFGGHFPEQPVVPGACLLQMVQEVAQTVLGVAALKLQKADHLKFIAFIDPTVNKVLEMSFTYSIKEDSSLSLSGSLSVHNSGDLLEKGKLCFKFIGLLFRKGSADPRLK